MFVGIKPADIDKMKILGIYNLSRGNDACGVCIDNKVIKGVDIWHPNEIKRANFTNFIEQINLKTDKSHKNYTIMIHNRKASTSWNNRSNPENAHPFEIYNEDKTKIELIGAHNGTIFNIISLQKEFAVEGTFEVDSKAILTIIAKQRHAKKPFEVLKMYTGLAVLTWFYTDEPNTLYVWKGSSEEDAGKPKEERPMWVWEKDPLNCLYFSSMKESLLAIGGTTEDIYNLAVNTVYKFEAGKKALVFPINRTTETANFLKGSTPKILGTGVGNRLSTPQSCNNRPTKHTSLGKSASNELVEVTFLNYPNYKKAIKKARKKFGGIKANEVGYALLECEPFTFDTNKDKNKVFFFGGRYYQNGHIIADNSNPTKDYKELTLDYLGYPEDSKAKKFNKEGASKWYFYMGFLLIDKEAAENLKQLLVDHPDHVLTEAPKMYEKTVFNIPILAKYVMGFCCNYGDIKGSARSFDPKGSDYAHGDYYPFFDWNRKYSFKLGMFMGAEFNNDNPTETAVLFGKTSGRVIEVVAQNKIGFKFGPNNPLDSIHSKILLQGVNIRPKEKKVKEIDPAEKEEILNTYLDFITDGEAFEAAYSKPLEDTELEKLVKAIGNTIRHVKRVYQEVEESTDNNIENDTEVKRGLLYSPES